jgi:hypothetical protein
MKWIPATAPVQSAEEKNGDESEESAKKALTVPELASLGDSALAALRNIPPHPPKPSCVGWSLLSDCLLSKTGTGTKASVKSTRVLAKNFNTSRA